MVIAAMRMTDLVNINDTLRTENSPLIRSYMTFGNDCDGIGQKDGWADYRGV
jgi:hypothetical protein